MSIKAAVIGAGHLGKIHAKLLRQIDGVEVIAVVDPNAAAREKVEQDLQLPTQADWRELVGQIDAAVIAAPTEFHHSIGTELAGQGIHLLVEKPVTTTVAQARHLARLAHHRGSCIQVGHVERFNAAFSAATQAGVPRYIQCCRASGFTFRSTDVGVVLDLMIHDIDLVCHLAQSEISSVHAVGVSVFGKNEDMAQARLQFANGLVANLTASRCHPSPTRRMEVFGTRGYVEVDFANGQAKKICPPEWLRQREFDLDQVTEEQRSLIKEHLFDQVMSEEAFGCEPVNAILCEQQNWIEAIAKGKQHLQVPIQDGMRALEVATQIVEQIEQHGWNQPNSIQGPLLDPASLEQQPEVGIFKRAA